jgi:hypothetical protein
MSRRYPVVEGEMEDELVHELEEEFEDELEVQLDRELRGAYEDEDEDLHELEDELEAALGELEDEDEDFTDHEFETLVRELEAEFEDYEDEDEDERFTNPARRVYPDAELMAELALQAEYAENEHEAEGFLSLLAPLAIQAAKWAAPKIIKHAPGILRGAVNLGKRLWANPATRSAVRHVPKIISRAARDIAHRHAAGRPITGRHIAHALAGHTLDAVAGRKSGRHHHRTKSAGRRPAQAHRPRGTARRHKGRRSGGARRRQGKGRARRR